MAEKRRILKKHIVVFQDDEGNVLKTSFVPHGGSAVPPEIEVKKNAAEHHEYLFSGWDQDFSRVENNLVIKAVYTKTPKKYLVLYFNDQDKMLGMETVPYGEAAKAQIIPQKEGNREFEYVFSGWSVSLHCITGDTRAKAVFQKKRKEFSVLFLEEDGRLMQEETVFYGESASVPPAPQKKADKRYYYQFKEWKIIKGEDCAVEKVTADMELQVVFTAIPQEYAIRFWDQEKCVETKTYHYEETIEYPPLRKKGYDLSWSEKPEKAEESCDLYAIWTFSHPVGKIVEADTGIYQILNPSLTHGSVRCISFKEETSVRVVIPERVRLGDYYYNIEKIGSRALEGCSSMETLYIPDTVKMIEEEGLSRCRRLRKVCLGEEVTTLGARAFADNLHLKEIVLPGKALRKCHRRAFARLASTVHVRLKGKYFDRCMKVIGNGAVGKVQFDKM